MSDSDRQAMTATVFLEARGEPEEGWKAVTWVIMNRVGRNKPHLGGGSIAGVCYKEWQFSCWNGNLGHHFNPSDYPDREVYWRISSQ